MSLSAKIESILFVASKPLSMAVLARATGEEKFAIVEVVEALKGKYNHEHSGIHLLSIGDEVMMGTNPAYADLVREFIDDEVAGELTKAQLETLTVVAYRGPVTRPELEQIRGVNCALILRNLLMRGLIEENGEDDILPRYSLSFEALRHLGIQSVAELSDYEHLHAHEHIEQTLKSEL